jgi:hypothetical protein
VVRGTASPAVTDRRYSSLGAVDTPKLNGLG